MDRPEIDVMKKIRLLSLTGAALVGLGSTAWAGPHGGGGGFAGGGHFSGRHFGSYAGGPPPAAGFFRGGRFCGPTNGAFNPAPPKIYSHRCGSPSGRPPHAY